MHEQYFKKWPRLRDYATFVMNNRETEKTGYSPFFETWRFPAQFIDKCGQRSEVLSYLYIFTCKLFGPRCFHYLKVPKARHPQYLHVPYVQR